MLIERTSTISGIKRKKDLPVTEDQMAKFKSGKETIQSIFPNLSPSDREFIKTGIVDEEWDTVFAR